MSSSTVCSSPVALLDNNAPHNAGPISRPFATTVLRPLESLPKTLTPGRRPCRRGFFAAFAFPSPDEPVDAASVQVVRNGTVVTIAAAGAMLNKVPELASLTQSWAVGAGLAVLDLTR